MISNSANRKVNSRLYLPVDGVVNPGLLLLTAMQGYWNAETATAGSLTNLGTLGSGLDLQVVGAVYLASAARNYMYQVTGQNPTATAADDATYTPTTALDVRCAVAAEDWTPPAARNMVGQWTTNQFSWRLSLTTAGRLNLELSTTGTAVAGDSTSSASPVVADNDLIGVRATWTVSPAEVKYYTKAITAATAKSAIEDDTGWTQLGTTITASVPSAALFNSNTTVAFGNGTVAGTSPVNGKHYFHYVKVDGTVRVTFDPNLATGSSTSWTSAEGKTITMTRASTGQINALVEAGKSIFLLDGTDDYMFHADNNSVDFGTADSFSLATVHRIWGTPLNLAAHLGKRDQAGALGYSLMSNGTAHSALFIIVQSTNTPQCTSPASSVGSLRMQTGVRDVAADTITAYNLATPGTPVADSTVSTLANASQIELGRRNATAFPRFELLGGFLTNRVVTASELTLIASVWGL